MSRNQWITFECFFCHVRMHGTFQKQKLRDGKEHVQTGYRCPDCGYRIWNEVSREQAIQVVDEKCLPPAIA